MRSPWALLRANLLASRQRECLLPDLLTEPWTVPYSPSTTCDGRRMCGLPGLFPVLVPGWSCDHGCPSVCLFIIQSPVLPRLH